MPASLTDAHIRHSLADSAQAWEDFASQMQIFKSLCQLGREDEIEPQRAAMHVLLDAHLDQYAVASRLARTPDGDT